MSLESGRVKRSKAYCMEFFSIFFVVSRYSVSFGGFLWNTTLFMDDLPLLRVVNTPKVGEIRFQAHLFWPMSRSRGLPSPALLLGSLPV
jgi:hypothetical protein